MGDAAVSVTSRQPIWSALLQYGRSVVLEQVDQFFQDAINEQEETVTLPLEIWSQIRYSIYRWIATRLGYKVRTKYFECIYALVEKYFSKSIVGFEPANNVI
jgi:hypothetical protein